MAEELSPADVQEYTRGRISEDDPETQRSIDAALARARRFCGWHVTPVRTETLIFDRPDSPSVFLPSQKILSIASVSVGGTPVDLTDVRHDSSGMLNYGRMRGSSEFGYGQISVTLTHGYTAAEAADFREVVLQLIDQADINNGTGATGPIIGKEIDDVSVRWSGMVDRSWGIAKNPMNESVLYQYRIIPFA